MNAATERFVAALAMTVVAITVVGGGLLTAVVPAQAASPAAQTASAGQTFATPEEAVTALAGAVKQSSVDQLMALFGAGGQDLVSSADPATARQNREVFMVAFSEGWHLVDDKPNRKTLVVGNENWPFPVPLVKAANRWHFDAAAGKEEVIARRIGRNELQVIDICKTYVASQQRYARDGHDGIAAGSYAQSFRSDPGRHNGLYWPDAKGEPKSPLGDLMSQAADEGRATGPTASELSPFYGYYFKILKSQGKSAKGGAKSYVVSGNMTGGFALVAWPAQYDATGVMTFIVNQDGVLRQKDLGPQTGATAKAMTLYNPDASWHEVSER